MNPINGMGAAILIVLLAVVLYLAFIGAPREKAYRYSLCGEGVRYCNALRAALTGDTP